LKHYGFSQLPIEWTSHLDFESKPAANIERLFSKVKNLKAKAAGAQKRIEILRGEVEDLQDLSEEAYQRDLLQRRDRRQAVTARRPAEAQMRKFVLDEDQQLICWMGKNAGENLKLLRSSKSWDYWLHLKDYPSAFAILQRTRDQRVADAAIHRAAHWLATESFRGKKNLQGIKLAVVMTECRFVKPIKGDKIGRVTYHNARELLITL
jgi:predicted ribosome quality control (RQC) complex YloA/Tae2 family protein